MRSFVLNQQLSGSLLEEKGIQLFIKREDLYFPAIPGNKWRKLKYNLAFAQENGFKHIVSFGGAFSNHLAALALAGKIFGIKTTGIVRGELPSPLNATLSKATLDGMDLQSVDRSTYKEYTQGKHWDALKETYPDAYFIPEGGTNLLALKGSAEIVTDSKAGQYDYWCCPVGTGGTISGILSALDSRQKVLAFPALKGTFLKKEIDELTTAYTGKCFTNYSIVSDYHFGGYAKFKPALIDFIIDFYAQHKIPLDPIYTGKMLYGIMDLIEKDYFPRGSRIVAVHTGGLQGIAGFNERFGTEINVQ